jgi:hypothetical protein
LVDSPVAAKDLRRGRSAAQNLVPSSTGAAHAAGLALPTLQGRFDGVAIRGPVVVGSLSDLVFLLSRHTTSKEVNDVLRQEVATNRYRGVLGVTDEPLVSADIVKDPRASIVQLDLTRAVGGNLVKVMSWYDSEWGFTNQMVQVAIDQLCLGTTTQRPCERPLDAWLPIADSRLGRHRTQPFLWPRIHGAPNIRLEPSCFRGRDEAVPRPPAQAGAAQPLVRVRWPLEDFGCFVKWREPGPMRNQRGLHDRSVSDVRGFLRVELLNRDELGRTEATKTSPRG